MSLVTLALWGVLVCFSAPSWSKSTTPSHVSVKQALQKMLINTGKVPASLDPPAPTPKLTDSPAAPLGLPSKVNHSSTMATSSPEPTPTAIPDFNARMNNVSGVDAANAKMNNYSSNFTPPHCKEQMPYIELRPDAFPENVEHKVYTAAPCPPFCPSTQGGKKETEEDEVESDATPSPNPTATAVPPSPTPTPSPVYIIQNTLRASKKIKCDQQTTPPCPLDDCHRLDNYNKRALDLNETSGAVRINNTKSVDPRCNFAQDLKAIRYYMAMKDNSGNDSNNSSDVEEPEDYRTEMEKVNQEAMRNTAKASGMPRGPPVNPDN